MTLRKSIAAVAATTLTGSLLVLSGGAAHAAEADDPAFTPVSADLIGVGSDTSQHAVHLLADGWNSANPSPSPRIASFAATGGGQITLPNGAISRPNGSGAGKALLYGAGNNPEVDFARSSSAISTTEQSNGLKAFPFALDTLKMAVSNSVPSNAPTSLTPANIVGIYKGDITNWSQIDPSKSGVIEPKIPQAGSGTRSFFVAQLKSMNSGTDVTLGANVVEVQEHDDTLIKNNPNAIAPFSEGRAALLGSTLRLETGWKADRALYNVVRGSDLGNSTIQAVFGESGYICSTAARSLIEQAGFKQLATPARGGVCGAATDTATSNFTLNEAVVTATSLTGSSTRGNVANLVAAVTGSTAPDGTVSFYEGVNLLQSNVPLVSGQATYQDTTNPGTHTYRAVFVPTGGSQFEGSEDTGDVLVKAVSTVSEAFAPAVAAGQRARGVVKVALSGVGAKATGPVSVSLGRKVVGKGSLANGKATLRLARLPKGKNKLTASYKGSSIAAPDVLKFVIRQR